MNEITIKKRDKLIAYFGSVEKYQLEIFDKVPPIFMMSCDKNGNVIGCHESMKQYLIKEINKSNMTAKEIIERDSKIFEKIISDLYIKLFS